MKKLLLLLIAILLLTGCTISDTKELSIDDITNKVLSSKTRLSNQTFVGFDLYIPKHLVLLEKEDFNIVLSNENGKFYLYLDVVSYYHKSENTYVENEEVYYSKKLNINDKTGYLNITQGKDLYFIEIVYNYAKIEGYVDKDSINETIVDMLIILKNTNYNDIVLKALIGEINLTSSEERVNIFKPKETQQNVLQDLEDEIIEEEIIDEESIELNE